MRNLAVIPARGGSVRIPHKNICDFEGRPLISYSIEAAQKSGLFDMIMVSTDDEKIAATAREWGAEVPFMRSAELSDHYTGTFAVTKDAVLRLENECHQFFDSVCCIYATAPLLTPKYLKEAYELFVSSHADSVMACCEFNFPVQRAQYVDDDHCPHPFMPDCMPMRSQDLKKAVHDAGQFYFYAKNRFHPVDKHQEVVRVFELPRHRVLDIDTPEDLALARVMFRAIKELGLD